MTNLLNVSEELKFAIECGIKIEYTVLEDGDIQASWNGGKCVEIIEVATSEEITQVETVEEFEEVEVVTVEEIANEYNLTEKEIVVLKGVINDQFEDGLPPFTSAVAKFAKLTERQTVGVISSLYKKGFLESYGENEEMLNCKDMYHLTSEWFEKFKGYC
jgi:hypothetical protein